MQVPLNSSLIRAVRSKETGLYLTERGEWTEEMKCAANWTDINEVVGLCSRFKLKNVELVLHLGDPRYDVAVDLREQY